MKQLILSTHPDNEFVISSGLQAWEFIKKLTDWIDDVSITNRSDGQWMLINYIENYGWHISSCATSDQIEYFLSSNDTSGSTMSFKRPGITEEIPLKLIVNEDTAREAVIYYAENLARNPTLKWVEVNLAFKRN